MGFKASPLHFMCTFLCCCFPSDGRGFIKQGHGGSAGDEGGDVEGATGGREMEVSSAKFALVRHNEYWYM